MATKTTKRKATKQRTVPADIAEARRRRVMTPPETLGYGPFGRKSQPRNYVGYRATFELSEGGKSTPPRAMSTDGIYRYDLADVRAQSQDFDANNSLYAGMVSRILDFVLGSGSVLQVMSDDQALNDKVERLWDEFWRNPEVRGMVSGEEFERQELRHAIVDGDVLRVEVGGGKVQTIIADQVDIGMPLSISDKRVIEQGVELDEQRRPVAFHVSPFTPYGFLYSGKARRIEAEKCTFLAFRRRVDQTRGEPIMLPAFPMLHRVNDMCDSTAVAAQLLSRFGVVIQRQDSARLAYGSSTQDAAAASNASAISNRVHELDKAIIFHAEPGEDIKGVDHNIPGQNFVESLKMFLRLIGQAFGFSLEFVLLIWSDTNYSSGRASAKQVERNTARIRRMVGQANSHTYMQRLAQWRADGALTDDEVARASRHEFRFPPYPFIDPEKERAAQVDAVRAGFSTMTREAKASGEDYPEILAETQREIEMAIAAAATLNAAHPDAGVSWRDFRPISEGGQSELIRAAAAPAPAQEAAI